MAGGDSVLPFIYGNKGGGQITRSLASLWQLLAAQRPGLEPNPRYQSSGVLQTPAAPSELCVRMRQ